MQFQAAHPDAVQLASIQKPLANGGTRLDEGGLAMTKRTRSHWRFILSGTFGKNVVEEFSEQATVAVGNLTRADLELLR